MGDRAKKKQKPSSSHEGGRRRQRSPTPSPPPSSPHPVHDLFSTVEQQEKFAKHFVNREVLESKYLDAEYFEESNFEFYQILCAAGLKEFVCLSDSFYPELVRVFYNNMVISHTGVIRTEVKGVKIKISPKVFNEITLLPSKGAPFEGRIVDEWKEDYNSISGREFVRREDAEVLPRLTAGQMKVQHRILHYVLTRILCPRSTNIGQPTEEDIMLIWALFNGKEINWGHLIRYKMKKALKDKAKLPYPHLITLFLDRFEVPIDNDPVTGIMPKQKMDYDTIRSFGYVQNPHGEWVIGKQNPPNAEDEATEDEDIDEDNSSTTLSDVMNRIDQIQSFVASRFDGIQNRFDQLETTMGTRFDNFQTQFGNIDTAIGSMEEELQHLRMRFDNAPQS
ncbi:hypothetical protein V8G54_016079 [Vigna mungo]|uniref:Putative plant transposon protein domain-containing protein n=1 Tax=Vigna mungo TaxID=3915 RepID=A0AAQ3NJK9_VIGMU